MNRNWFGAVVGLCLALAAMGLAKNIHVAAGWNNVSRDGAVRCEVQRPLPVLSLACFVFLTHLDGKSI